MTCSSSTPSTVQVGTVNITLFVSVLTLNFLFVFKSVLTVVKIVYPQCALSSLLL